MAKKMSKTAARKRLQEALKKCNLVYFESGGMLSLKDLTAIDKILMSAIRKCK
jgi:hypothetical protein